jgi:hypothetical protein
MKTMSLIFACLVTPSLASPAFAQQTGQTLQKTQTQSANATRGAITSITAATQARGGFDTAPKAATPVQAQPAAKPNPVGQPVTSTATATGYKPAQNKGNLDHINVPSPTTGRK